MNFVMRTIRAHTFRCIKLCSNIDQVDVCNDLSAYLIVSWPAGVKSQRPEERNKPKDLTSLLLLFSCDHDICYADLHNPGNILAQSCMYLVFVPI